MTLEKGKKVYYLVVDDDYISYSAVASSAKEFFEECKNMTIFEEHEGCSLTIVTEVGVISMNGWKLKETTQ